MIFFYDRKHSTFFQWEYMNSWERLGKQTCWSCCGCSPYIYRGRPTGSGGLRGFWSVSGIAHTWWWFLMTLDGSWCCIPWSKRHRKPMLFGISNRGPHHFPRCVWSTGSSTSLVWWENLQETPMFHGKIPGFRDVSADFCQHQFIDQPGTVSIATSEFVFFPRWLRRILASLGCRRDWINAVICVMMF